MKNLKLREDKKPKLKREFSAGGVVYKQEGSKVLWLLGKHSGYHKWVLPKGQIEEGETSVQTAIRETEEEVGVETKLAFNKPVLKDHYFYYTDPTEDEKSRQRQFFKERKKQVGNGNKVRVSKTVTFFLLEYLSGDPKKDHCWEMEEVGWFEYKKALKQLAFKGEREALMKASEVLGAMKESLSLF
ncbi:NUDIX domain-containing protein [Patescibacteria group bacterium]